MKLEEFSNHSQTMNKKVQLDNGEASTIRSDESDVICKIEPIESPPDNTEGGQTMKYAVGQISYRAIAAPEQQNGRNCLDSHSGVDGTCDSNTVPDDDYELFDNDSTRSQSTNSPLGVYDTDIQDGRQSFDNALTDVVKLPIETIRCNQCGTYIAEDLLRSHIDHSHPDQDVNFVCDVCGKGYKFESGLILHKVNHHNGVLVTPGSSGDDPVHDLRSQSQMVCKICGKSFIHATSFTVHLENHHLEKIYECEICYKSFIIKSDFDEHVNFHTNLDQNQCFICGIMCRNSTVFKRHLRKHSKEAKYKCRKCPRFFQEESDLAVHTVMHSLDADLQCRICDQRFQSKKEKEKHHKKHINEWRCSLCGKAFGNRGLLSTHKNVVHPNKDLFSCNFCSKKFNNNKELQKHRLVHMEKKVCHFCGNEFSLRSELIKHLEVHSNETVYRCVVCPEWCFNMERLEEHVENHKEEVLDCCVCGQQLSDTSDVMTHAMQHSRKSSAEESSGSPSDVIDNSNNLKERKMEECNICGKTFHFVSSLQSHLRVHETDQTLKCHICAQECKGIKMLREHIKTHETTDENTAGVDVPREGEKFKHRCDICLEKFRNYYTCKKHRLLHTGERSFKCDVCGKTFILAGALKIHRLSHTVNKPHVCEICGKSFKQPYILREHQMTHTGIKPFLCDLCGKSFVNRKKLQLHVFVHTRETPFNCKVCKRGFRASITRKKHICSGPPEPEAADGQLAENPYNLLDAVQDKDMVNVPGYDHCSASSTSGLESVSSSIYQTTKLPDGAFFHGIEFGGLPEMSADVP